MVTAAERQRVGTLIKKRRQELGIRTQAELAALVGTSPTSVAKWEAGKYYPSRFLGKLEAVLRMDLTGDIVLLPPADAHERALWDLLTGDDVPEDKRLTPAGAWEVIEEYRRRVKRRAEQRA